MLRSLCSYNSSLKKKLFTTNQLRYTIIISLITFSAYSFRGFSQKVTRVPDGKNSRAIRISPSHRVHRVKYLQNRFMNKT